MLKHGGHELIEAEFVMNAVEILAEQDHFEKNREVLFGLFDEFTTNHKVLLVPFLLPCNHSSCLQFFGSKSILSPRFYLVL